MWPRMYMLLVCDTVHKLMLDLLGGNVLLLALVLVHGCTWEKGHVCGGRCRCQLLFDAHHRCNEREVAGSVFAVNKGCIICSQMNNR